MYSKSNQLEIMGNNLIFNIACGGLKYLKLLPNQGERSIIYKISRVTPFAIMY